MTAIEIAIEALRQWKCGGCSGDGLRRYDPQISSHGAHCVICHGSGLNPIADKALAALLRRREGRKQNPRDNRLG